MSDNSSRKRSHPDSPDPISPKQIKHEIKAEIDEESDSETVIIPRDQNPKTKENLEKLKAENAQLRSKLYQLESVVLPGKDLEVEKLHEKLTFHQTEIDKVNMENESRQEKYKEVDFKLKETERALKASVEKNESLSSSFQVQIRDINNLHMRELESLESELADKNLKLGEATKISSELRLQLESRLRSHKLDMQSAKAQFQEKDEELAKTQKKLEEIQNQFQESLQKWNAEKDAIRERAQKENMELVGVNLEHQKEIYQLRDRLEDLEAGQTNPFDFDGENVNDVTIRPTMKVSIKLSSIAAIASSIYNDLKVSKAPIPRALEVFKPRSCSICKKFYLTKQSLQIHEASSHPSRPLKVYKCPYCGITRKYRRDFQAHFKSAQTTKCQEKRPADFNYREMVLGDYKTTMEERKIEKRRRLKTLNDKNIG